MINAGTLVNRGNRLAAVVIGALTFCIVYWGAAAAAWRSPIVLVPTLFDRQIPFVPVAIWIYLSAMPLFLLIVWVPDDQSRSRAFISMAIALAVAGVVFLLFPAGIPRQSPDPSGLTGAAWKLLYAVDTAGNALPSLHAALAAIAGSVLWREGRAWRVIGSVWLVAILAAALATKQHFVVDLVAGLCLGITALLIAGRVVKTQAGEERNRVMRGEA